MDDDTRRSRVLHALRLGAVLDLEGVARRSSLTPEGVEPVLADLAARGWVAERRSPPVGWSLTAAGRTVEDQAMRHGSTSESTLGVQRAYDRFLTVNAVFLEVCTRWQLRPGPGEEELLNDHLDDAYDRRVLAELGDLHPIALEVADTATAAVDRFEHYRPRFEHAWERLGRNEVDWFTKPLIDSYHTVWFELHEDLLATLGRTRSSERREAVGPQPPPAPG